MSSPSLINYADNFMNIDSSIWYKKHESLLLYTNFDMKLILAYMCQLFRGCKNDKILFHVIDNAINLNHASDCNHRLLTYALMFASSSVIIKLIDKGVDLEYVETSAHYRPIHLAARYSTPQVLKHLIGKVDLEAETKYGERLIHIVAKKLDYDTIKYVINLDVRLDINLHTYKNRSVSLDVKHLILLNKRVDICDKIDLLNIIDQKLDNNFVSKRQRIDNT
ncbi:MAG: hypothetical protein Homavirus30_7 [Homavirus sp.]|uniref:Uncharacterized protein n=1 Tax=Homavirus sp. TaxID=2487769 RepID=A0A3G5A4Z8_9VIRU|nr:MAG: hypothetical protein Homavirus30_7 [Homavirus sp.]